MYIVNILIILIKASINLLVLICATRVLFLKLHKVVADCRGYKKTLYVYLINVYVIIHIIFFKTSLILII